jgi:hypothetical protein
MGKYFEFFPGSPAACAHGNREFSFLARKSTSATSIVLFFLAGGTCWDETSCGIDPATRTVAIDNLQFDSAPSVPNSFKDTLQVSHIPPASSLRAVDLHGNRNASFGMAAGWLCNGSITEPSG